MSTTKANKYYAGIGSRETPLSLCPVIQDIAMALQKRKYILRSGGAKGADKFFESKVDKPWKEIILPWKDYEGNTSTIYEVPNEAYKIAAKYHPAWDALTPTVKKIMARNSCQILGLDLKTPVDFVVCWTKDGKATGGTGQALRIAMDMNIPIFNLKIPGDLERFKAHVFTASIF